MINRSDIWRAIVFPACFDSSFVEISGFRDLRRMDHGRGLESGDLAAARRGCGASGVGRGSSLPGERGSHAKRGRARFDPD